MSLVAHSLTPPHSVALHVYCRDVAVIEVSKEAITSFSNLSEFPNRSIADDHVPRYELVQSVNHLISAIDSIIRIGPVVAIERTRTVSRPEYVLHNFMGFSLRDRYRGPNALYLPLGEMPLEADVNLLPISLMSEQLDEAVRKQLDGIRPELFISAEAFKKLEPSTQAHFSVQPGQALLIPEDVVCSRWCNETDVLRIKGFFKVDPTSMQSPVELAENLACLRNQYPLV